MDSSSFSLQIGPFKKIRGIWLDFTITIFYRIPVFNSNSADHDQMPHSVASDLGLCCLPMPHFWKPCLVL